MSTAYRVRRPLTDAEITTIWHEVKAATSGAAIVAAATRAVFTTLLAPLGESLADYGPGRKLDPGQFTIPQTQWQAIAETCLSAADAYGARVDVALELINFMPTTYDDPAAPVPPEPRVDRRPYEHVLRVSREATDEIAAASAHCDRLGTYFGTASSEYRNAAKSWYRNLTQMFSMGLGADTRVTRDGDLSLFVQSASGMVYAIIFHPHQRRCTRDGCTATINDYGDARSYLRDGPVCPDGEHTPSYPLDAPWPGTWSFHS